MVELIASNKEKIKELVAVLKRALKVRDQINPLKDAGRDCTMREQYFNIRINSIGDRR